MISLRVALLKLTYFALVVLFVTPLSLSAEANPVSFQDYYKEYACDTGAMFDLAEDKNIPAMANIEGYSYAAVDQRLAHMRAFRQYLSSISVVGCSEMVPRIFATMDQLYNEVSNQAIRYRHGEISANQLRNFQKQIEPSYMAELDRLLQALQVRRNSNDQILLQKAVEVIQKTLSESGFSSVRINGNFDQATQQALQSFVLALQSDTEFWGVGWSGPKDGNLSDRFLNHLFEKLPQSNNVQYAQEMLDALDVIFFLDAPVAEGFVPRALPGAPAQQSTSSSRGSNGGDAGMAIFFPLIQGLTLEWGDELTCENAQTDNTICRANMASMIEAYEKDFGTMAIISNFVGVMLSPFGVIFIFFFASSTKNSGEAFKGGFIAEMVEGGISAAGIISTHGELQGAGYFLIATVIAGVLTGAIATTKAG